MLLQLQRYNYELVYLPSSQMVLADTLLPVAGESTVFQEELAATLSSVDANQMSDLKMIASPETIKSIKLIIAAVKDDDEYDCNDCLIKQINLVGQILWVEYHRVNERITRSLMNSVSAMAWCSKIIASSFRWQTGINGCLRRAKEIVYWPGITTYIKHLVEACPVCVSFEQTTQKEPLLSHSTPSRVWETVGVDIFQFADTEIRCLS